jgi:hypothetical protein
MVGQAKSPLSLPLPRGPLRVPFDSYIGLVADMPGEDPDDRVHMAAAVATHIVTHNLADFPAARLAEHGVTVTDPDT